MVATATASVLFVNVLADCLPVAVLLYIAMWLCALSYLVFMCACVGAIASHAALSPTNRACGGKSIQVRVACEEDGSSHTLTRHAARARPI